MINIHIEKQPQGSKRKNNAKSVWNNESLNNKYVIDYFSNSKYVIIRGLKMMENLQDLYINLKYDNCDFKVLSYHDGESLEFSYKMKRFTAYPIIGGLCINHTYRKTDFKGKYKTYDKHICKLKQRFTVDTIRNAINDYMERGL